MTDPAFVSGIVAGVIITAVVIIGAIAIMRPRKVREPIDWEERTYHPPVATRVLIKERNYDI